MILNGLNAATEHNLYQQPDTQQIFVFITVRELRIGPRQRNQHQEFQRITYFDDRNTI